MKLSSGVVLGGGVLVRFLPVLIVAQILQATGCVDPAEKYIDERAALAGDRFHAEEAYIQFAFDDRAELEQLTRLVSISDVRDGQVWAYASPRQLGELHEAGYRWTELPHPGVNSDVRMGLIGPDGGKLWDHYPTYSEYVDVMHQFVDDYPDLCRLYDIGDSTNQSRPHKLWALKITDNPDHNEDEPEVFYTSTMHGDETTGYVVLLQFIEELLSNYGADAEITELVDNLEIWINPLANPDGTYYGGDNSVGSAIRSYTTSSGGYTGVDPNRNFPDPVAGNHPDGNSWWRETEAMMDFAASRSFVIAANFHGGVAVINYPWDCQSARHTDDDWFIQVSREYADNCQADGWAGYMNDMNNGITNGYDWYVVYGGRQDYMLYWHGCREVTVEISVPSTPSASSLDDYWQANRQALLDYIKNALSGIRGTVTNPSGQPLPATVEVLGYDDPGDQPYVYTDPGSGDYHRMLLPGSYDLRFTSDNCQSQDVLAVDVNMGPATRVDVVLEPLPCSGAADCDLWQVNLHECIQGECLIVTCDAGWGDCNQIDSDGCEQDLSSDPSSCGACDNACDLPNAVSLCIAGQCQISSCQGDYQDCNMNPQDGCEADPSVDPLNCGACNNICAFPHSVPTCQAGGCVLGACDSLWDNCDGISSNGCETDISSDSGNCGGCELVCQLANASAECTQGVCSIVACEAFFLDCNQLPQDGCETAGNDDLENCGACGNACDYANAAALCVSGACRMGSCHQGFGDCNQNEADGCEGDFMSDPASCGGCGIACDLPNATAACSQGECAVDSCADLFGDCNQNSQDGCETSLAGNPDHCGQCNDACDLFGATSICQQGACQVDECDSGRGNCNNNHLDGCETDLQRNSLNCGACYNTCPADQICWQGACRSSCPDVDGDGYQDVNCGGDDCNDTEAIFNPGANEVCNGEDDDCNGQVDDGINCEPDGCGCSSAQSTAKGTLLLLALLGFCLRPGRRQ